MVLGYPLDLVTLDEAALRVVELAHSATGALVVTLNPEIVVRAEGDVRLREAIAGSALCVADGVGLVWAARRGGVRVPERVPGVDLAARAMAAGAGGLRVYFLGGRPGVAERAATAARRRFGIAVAGARDGFFGSDEEQGVVEEVRASGANLLLAGLGERQELFLAQHRAALGVGVAMGVGGTLDVLAGAVRRTPTWTRRWGVEWAWRVGLDPGRWHRAPRLARFVRLVLSRG